MTKQLAVVNNTTDDSNKAVISLSESFFPVFSEQMQDYKVVSCVLRDSKKNISSPIQNYKFSFEYAHFKPPIV
ncbi:hypothetical protein [Winogradskyella sp.]|uniref:hypothetical protein n=1 Tax=Winogradskyella sp. TaxID=1883156 RepID=UPI00262AEEA5|nr:hypothetical protein [Winogradskyella sp.]